MSFLVKGTNLLKIRSLTGRCTCKFACIRSQHNDSISQATGDGSDYISVQTDPEFDGSVAILQMQKKRGNSICSDFAKQLAKAVHDAGQNEKIRAIIITSSLPGIFGTGVDFTAVVDKTQDEVYDFVKCLHEFTFEIYSSRLVTVAAINGHCVAGTCAIPFGADYRVMADGEYIIGVNETRVGVTLPFYLRQMLQNLIGYNEAAKAVQLGTLFKSTEAYKLGLVDEMVPSDQVLTVARQQVKKWLQIPDAARIATKMDIRQNQIDEMHRRREEGIQKLANAFCSPQGQAVIKKALERLKKN